MIDKVTCDTDVIVLGAGIVGVSAALHLARRGLTVALVDRRGAGEETSYGNAGVIEGNTLFAHAFPKGFGALLRIALKQAPEANYHLSALPQLAPWLLAYRANTRGSRALQFAEAMRPLYARAVGEHEALMAESSATRYLRKDGWLLLSTHGAWLYHPHPHDYRRWTAEGLRREVEAQGFRLARMQALVGPLAWTTVFRSLGVAHVLRAIPLVGTLIQPALTVALNVCAWMEDQVTPEHITANNACIYVGLFSRDG